MYTSLASPPRGTLCVCVWVWMWVCGCVWVCVWVCVGVWVCVCAIGFHHTHSPRGGGKVEWLLLWEWEGGGASWLSWSSPRGTKHQNDQPPRPTTTMVGDGWVGGLHLSWGGRGLAIAVVQESSAAKTLRGGTCAAGPLRRPWNPSIAGQRDHPLILNCFSLWCRYQGIACGLSPPSRPTRGPEISNNLILNYINVIFPGFSGAAIKALHWWPFATGSPSRPTRGPEISNNLLYLFPDSFP